MQREKKIPIYKRCKLRFFSFIRRMQNSVIPWCTGVSQTIHQLTAHLPEREETLLIGI